MTIANIESFARAIVDANTTSLPNATLLIYENVAYEDIVSQILQADGRWEFDDSNRTDFPIGTTTLVNNQQDYTFDSSVLEVERVEVQDNTGLWHLLEPIDRSQIPFAMNEYEKTAGIPAKYIKDGKSIILYPAPSSADVTLSNGLKVYFRRTAYTFTSGDQSTGTITPGFASPFHVLLAWKSALPYAITYKPQRVPAILSEINRLEKNLKEFYSHREKDKRKVMGTKPISFR